MDFSSAQMFSESLVPRSGNIIFKFSNVYLFNKMHPGKEDEN